MKYGMVSFGSEVNVVSVDGLKEVYETIQLDGIENVREVDGDLYGVMNEEFGVWFLNVDKWDGVKFVYGVNGMREWDESKDKVIDLYDDCGYADDEFLMVDEGVLEGNDEEMMIRIRRR